MAAEGLGCLLLERYASPNPVLFVAGFELQERGRGVQHEPIDGHLVEFVISKAGFDGNAVKHGAVVARQDDVSTFVVGDPLLGSIGCSRDEVAGLVECQRPLVFLNTASDLWQVAEGVGGEDAGVEQPRCKLADDLFALAAGGGREGGGFLGGLSPPFDGGGNPGVRDVSGLSESRGDEGKQIGANVPHAQVTLVGGGDGRGECFDVCGEVFGADHVRPIEHTPPNEFVTLAGVELADPRNKVGFERHVVAAGGKQSLDLVAHPVGGSFVVGYTELPGRPVRRTEAHGKPTIGFEAQNIRGLHLHGVTP